MRSEKTGMKLETLIESQFDEYTKVSVKEMENIVLHNTSGKYYTKNFPLGICLYPLLNRREEFFLYGSPLYPDGLLITAKWQQATGTVYEKAPYIVLNIKGHHPYPTIVVWDGDFTRHGVEGAYLWLKSQIGENFIDVFRIADFLSWANKGGI